MSGAAHSAPELALKELAREFRPDEARKVTRVARHHAELPLARTSEAAEPVANIFGEPAHLGEFAVVDDVDAHVGLLAHHVGDRGGQFFLDVR